MVAGSTVTNSFPFIPVRVKYILLLVGIQSAVKINLCPAIKSVRSQHPAIGRIVRFSHLPYGCNILPIHIFHQVKRSFPGIAFLPDIAWRVPLFRIEGGYDLCFLFALKFGCQRGRTGIGVGCQIFDYHFITVRFQSQLGSGADRFIVDEHFECTAPETSSEPFV